MNKILIIYPHFPPSNLAGVHRPRLFAMHLSEFGWDPIVLTVHEKYYEEQPDWNLCKLLPSSLKISKVNAFPLTKPRLIGDIGLRAFFQLYKRAVKLIKKENISFVFIPIPSFYCALLGRLLHWKSGVRYGIDYIDPWVHEFPGSNKRLSRHWFSSKFAKFLEPIAVKNASLITGVAEGYYKEVLKRNPHLLKVTYGAMPYGGEQQDHKLGEQLNLKPYLFEKVVGKTQLMYAGAMLPKAYKPLEAIFRAIVTDQAQFSQIEFHFIGTGSGGDDPNSYNIKPLAEKYGLWQKVIFEYPARIPYLDVLTHLNVADGVFILGSTEPHYTPSKTYQGVLSGKPILAVLHSESTAVKVIEQSQAGIVLNFKGESGLEMIESTFNQFFLRWLSFYSSFEKEQVDISMFENYSAKNVTGKLAKLLDQAILSDTTDNE